MQNIHPHLRNILEFDADPNIKTKACIKIKTKWEEELYNDKVVQEDDDGDITLNPMKGL